MGSGHVSGLMDFKSSIRKWKVNSVSKKPDTYLTLNSSPSPSHGNLIPSSIKNAANIALNGKKN